MGLGKSKSLKEPVCSADFITDTIMIKAFDAIMSVKISGDADANAGSPSKGTVSSAQVFDAKCGEFFNRFETQSCRVGDQTISASEFKATCNKAKMVLRFDPATGNILAFKGSTLNVEILKDIALLVGTGATIFLRFSFEIRMNKIKTRRTYQGTQTYKIDLLIKLKNENEATQYR